MAKSKSTSKKPHPSRGERAESPEGEAAQREKASAAGKSWRGERDDADD